MSLKHHQTKGKQKEKNQNQTYLLGMIQIEINNTYTLPTSWDEVTLEKYINILNAKLDELTSNVLKQVRCIAILAGDPTIETEIRQLSSSDLSTILTTFSWINVTPDYNSLPPMNEIEVDGVTYKIKSDFNQLTVDEVITIEELMQAKQYDLHHFEVAFAVLFRRLDENGNEHDLSVDLLLETILALRDKVMLKDVFAVLTFFLVGGQEPSTQTSQSSSANLTSPTLKLKNL